jgi:hypothetical protein
MTIAVVDDHALLRKAVNFRLTGLGPVTQSGKLPFNGPGL